MNELAVVCRFGVATIFVLAGVAKLARWSEFVDAVRNYHLLPDRFGVVVARMIPPLELVVGVLLFAGVMITPVAAVAGTSLVVFSVAVAINLMRGRRIECGCFGVAESRLTWATVVRNCILALAAGFVVWRPVSALSVVGRTSGSVDRGAAFALLMVGTMVVFFSSLVQEAFRVHRLARSAPGGHS